MKTSSRKGLGRRARLTTRGWMFLVAAVVLALCAYAVGRPVLLFFAVFLGAAPLLSLALVQFQKLRLGIRRSFSPPVVSAGRITTVSLEVSNLSSRPTAATLWRDTCGWAPEQSPTGMLGPLRSGLLRRKEPRASARLRYELRPPRRGVYEVGPFEVTVLDPFGLAQGTQLALESQPITVVPDAVALPDSGLVIAEAEGSSRQVHHRAIGNEPDVMTRSYRTGDALRRVHWRASAHHGDLMVRQEEHRSHSEASILLDTRRQGYRDFSSARDRHDAESAAFDWAVGFTASLVIHLQRSGFLVHMNETAPRQLAPADQTTEFLESLATVSLSTGDQEPGESLIGAGVRKTPGTVFAVLSDASDALIGSLAEGRTAFELAVAFVVRPSDDRVVDSLTRAGWKCVVVRRGDSMESAWLAVAAEPEAPDVWV